MNAQTWVRKAHARPGSMAGRPACENAMRLFINRVILAAS
jgi:hypothetical protein